MSSLMNTNTNTNTNTSANTNTTLETVHVDPRDINITFIDSGHKYIVATDPSSKYTSVTTWCHSHFPKFNADSVIENMMKGKNWNPENKYWGLTPAQIKADWNKNGANAAKAGTALHYQIECFMNTCVDSEQPVTHNTLLAHYSNGLIQDSPEWQQFINFAKDHPNLKPYRTEWKIYDDALKLAGSIDMVYELEDGTLAIYDWKRCKEITKTNGFGRSAITNCIQYLPDSNFWHYSLQLNTYKAILEKCYQRTVSSMVLVRLYPDETGATNQYELLPVPVLTEAMQDLFALRATQVRIGVV